MSYTPQLATMFDCCGILVPYRFFKNPEPVTAKMYIDSGHTPEVSENAVMEYNKTHLTETNEQYIDRIKKYLEAHIKDWWLKKSYSLITLNGKENAILGDLILSLGYKILVPMTKNPSGTEIILYKYDLLPQEEKKESEA